MKRIFQSQISSLGIILGFALFAAGILLAMMAFSSGAGATSNGADGKVAPQVLADLAGGGNASMVILLADQADVSAAYRMKDQDDRGWYVYRALTQHAARTQADLRAFLQGRGVSYQSFWAANMIVATGDRALVESLAARDDVARIDSNNPARWIEEPEVANFGVTANDPSAPNSVEWGVLNVNAPSVWSSGFTGTGIVVGHLDSGARWTHNALKPHYRGWNGASADHNYNWHDAIHSGGGSCGANSSQPCDDTGHGTHTAGSAVGDDGLGNQIGVAPGATWISCRNMDQGVGTPATYTECFQFMIAPTDSTGNNPNPALRPHVVSNSWGCPASEGCVSRTELETIVNNTQAAGIFVDASAGNSGPGCSTVFDAPGIHSASFTTGAFDINNALVGFSSRGPTTYYNPSLLKPNLSAPGVNVRSSTRTSDTSFGNLSGTSMAAPHIAGVVALLWSARPGLSRDIAATTALLQDTANPNVSAPFQTCGGTSSTQIPNNIFGYGRIDALAAVNAAPTTVLGNISARLRVESGDSALIGGFIITGTQPKKVLVRAIGPSLGLGDQLNNPTLQLRDSSGALLDENDDWKLSPNKLAILDSGLAPTHDLESAIVASPSANGAGYTAIVRGVNGGVGIGVIEIYDLDRSADSTLANISSRGFVQLDDKALFAGTFVLGPGRQRVVIRAIGPSLNIAGKLLDPTLQLLDANGAQLAFNDNWRTGGQETEIISTHLAPTDNAESALIYDLPANGANYTAIVRGAGGTTGIAVVEIYALD